MMGIEKHLEKEKTKTHTETQVVPPAKAIKGTRGDIDDEDDEESYYRCVFRTIKTIFYIFKGLFDICFDLPSYFWGIFTKNTFKPFYDTF